MSRNAVVTGLGLISVLGDSPEKAFDDLCRESAGSNDGAGSRTTDASRDHGGEISDFEPESYLGARNFRPLDRTARLLSAAAKLCLERSGWTPEMLKEEEVGIVAGTMFCSVHTISQFDCRAMKAGPVFASPLDFANTVMNAAASQTAILHNLRGLNTTITSGLCSGLQTLAYATDLISSNRADAVLVGGVEERCEESFLAFLRSGLLCASNGRRFPVPFDSRRNGFALSEGAALLMLESEESARRRDARILAVMRGHSTRYDVSRGKDPAKTVMTIADTMRDALSESGVSPENVDCLGASANGSVHYDRFEALAIQDVFNGSSINLPVTAIKSMMGEALGASGAIQTVAMVESMRNRRVPGIRRFTSCDREVSLPSLTSKCTNRSVDVGLINNVGLDGTCCSLVVEKGPGCAERQ